MSKISPKEREKITKAWEEDLGKMEHFLPTEKQDVRVSFNGSGVYRAIMDVVKRAVKKNTGAPLTTTEEVSLTLRISGLIAQAFDQGGIDWLLSEVEKELLPKAVSAEEKPGAQGLLSFEV